MNGFSGLRTLVIRFPGRGAAAALGLLGVLAVAAATGPAAAQVAKAYLTVTAADSHLLSGDVAGSYPVMALTPGQVLVSDAGTEEWKRVAYPPGAACYLRAEEATYDDAAKTATLDQASRLRAINLVNGRKGSWKVALESPLPAGTKLKVLGVEDDPEPRNRVYRVEAPEAARGWVRSDQVRASTPEEITSYLALHPGAEPTPVKPETPQVPSGEVNLAQPQVPTGTPASPPQAEAPTPAPEVTPGGEQRPVTPPARTSAQVYSDLMAAFDAVRRQPEQEAELETMIGEFQKAMAQLGGSESDARLRQAMEQRVEWLRLAKEIRDQRRAVAQAKESLTTDAQTLSARLAAIEKQKRYTLVGRLGASGVYDGVRLPRLYRVQAVGAAVPITLGYLRPDEKLGLETKLGRIVGIVGDGGLDPATGARVITPTRIDVLSAEDLEGRQAGSQAR